MTIERRYLESRDSYADRVNADRIVRNAVARDPHIAARDKQRVADTASRMVDSGKVHGSWRDIVDAARAVEDA
jgi:hypothetical protein